MLHLLAYILFASVGGLFLLSGGVYLLERGRYTVSGKRKLQLEQQFLTWQIVVEEHKVAQVFKDVQYGSRTLRAFSLLGGGIAGLFIVLVSGCIALLTTGTLLDGNSIPVEPFAEILFLALNAGGAIGFVIALKSLRGRAAQRITYGDVRQRRTSDYRSLAVHFLPAVLVIWSISAAYLYFHSDGAPVYISLVTNMRVVLPARIVGIIPVMMVLVVVFVEVNKPIMGEFWSIGLLAFAQSRWLQIGFPLANHLPDTLTTFLSLGTLIGCLLMILGSFQHLFNGHLGGTISGWPWRGERLGALQ